MSKKELIDKMVAAVMEDFNFDRVHRIMQNLNWKWDIGNQEMTVPSTYRMMKEPNDYSATQQPTMTSRSSSPTAAAVSLHLSTARPSRFSSSSPRQPPTLPTSSTWMQIER